MGSWSRDQKVCASCRYWSGSRKIDIWANFFKTDSNNSEGICYSGKSNSFRGMTMNEGSSCMGWEPYRED